MLVVRVWGIPNGNDLRGRGPLIFQTFEVIAGRRGLREERGFLTGEGRPIAGLLSNKKN